MNPHMQIGNEVGSPFDRPGELIDVLEPLRRGWRLIVFFMLVAVTGAALILARTKPVYTASATLLVLEQRGRPLNLLSNNVNSVTDLMATLDGYSNYLPTHCRIIRSPLVVESALAAVGRKDLPARAVIGRLSVKAPDAVGKTLEIQYTTDTRDEAAQILDAVIASYNRFLKENFQKSSREALSLIEKVSIKLNNDLDALEREYLEFRRKNPAYAFDENGRSLVARRLDQWDQLANRAMVRAFQLRAQLDIGRRFAREGKDLAVFARAVNQLEPDGTGVPFSEDKGIDDELKEVETRRRATERLIVHLREEMESLASQTEVSRDALARAFYDEPEAADLGEAVERARSKLRTAERVSRSRTDPAVVLAARQVREYQEQLTRLWRLRKPALLEKLLGVRVDPEPLRQAEAELIVLTAQRALLLERKDEARNAQLGNFGRPAGGLGAPAGAAVWPAGSNPAVPQIAGARREQPPSGAGGAWLDSVAQSLDSVEEVRARIQERFEEDLKGVKEAEVVQVQESNLRNNVERQRTLFASVVEQLKQAKLVSDYGDVTAQTLDPPSVSASRRESSRTILMALALGLAAGAAAAVAADQLDARVRSMAELRRILSYPVLAAVPELPKRGSPAIRTLGLVTHQAPRSPMSEAYRSVRTQMAYLGRDRAVQVMLVTSPEPGDGKSTTASNLAISFALTGCKVLLVDGDLRRPSLHRWYGLTCGRGFSDALRLGEAPGALVQRTEIENLDILTAGSDSAHPAELLASPRLGQFIAELRQSYHFVIIDSSPVLAVTDPSILAEMADGIVLVVRASATRRRSAHRTFELLAALGTPVLGTVINGVSREQLGCDFYGYGYGEVYGSTPDGRDGVDGETWTRRIPWLTRRIANRSRLPRQQDRSRQAPEPTNGAA